MNDERDGGILVRAGAGGYPRDGRGRGRIERGQKKDPMADDIEWPEELGQPRCEAGCSCEACEAAPARPRLGGRAWEGFRV